MTVLQVHDKETKSIFHKVLKYVYANDTKYEFPLKTDIDLVFNSEKSSI